ncbi:hypothetical protein E3T24_09460 [Cryobacterium sp. TmT2-59]|uniref:Uncharacterized protein n=1 Tax=Cryobacterium shii TaxID=1259235 RepID=A0AAQ2C8G9_9MICO|nr:MULTISPECIES: hypothetical protein [Cryobacterium]TFC52111.1 hypothetical protein E3O49_02175 [Cryobacterium shii]TFC84664.1 hypothetical protein E3T24_09460 [Cryobacterium sp. TmT2-59]TFD16257.1 hypothetical protein E3T32_15850 [Cryobacterium sp. TMT2-23]TFD19061.1 hypothetical protein E3T42_04445 [Cryobacterium sp. TMT4-10]
MPRPAGAREEWLHVLDQLETSLGSGARDAVLAVEGERLSTGVQWRAPEHLGQLPADLEKRARRLIAGQLELIREIEDARRSAGMHLAAVRTILSAQRTDQSVYLDVAG